MITEFVVYYCLDCLWNGYFGSEEEVFHTVQSQKVIFNSF